MPSISTDIDYKVLNRALLAAKGDNELFQAIVNVPFKKSPIQTTFLFLGIIVLLLVDKKSKSIRRIALSDTELAQRAVDVSPLPFEDIVIPLDSPRNIIVAAVKTGEPQNTTDWKNLFVPTLKAEHARINQANAGVGYSAVYPLTARDGGTIIFSYFQYREMINDLQTDFMTKYTYFVNKRLAAANAGRNPRR